MPKNDTDEKEPSLEELREFDDIDQSLDGITLEELDEINGDDLDEDDEFDNLDDLEEDDICDPYADFGMIQDEEGNWVYPDDLDSNGRLK